MLCSPLPSVYFRIDLQKKKISSAPHVDALSRASSEVVGHLGEKKSHLSRPIKVAHCFNPLSHVRKPDVSPSVKMRCSYTCVGRRINAVVGISLNLKKHSG
ncbi:hypothetical protein CEXT_729951 [Caerostris extrusa]|uniref:Uncharacterized protein n=1 Tax=Caerostris extrusa TaxID=172846 RepID=A0AAV4PE74_CAEEX|nr:hypothetical protein CEXT_729951 [Caerostris extrusa]